MQGAFSRKKGQLKLLIHVGQHPSQCITSRQKAILVTVKTRDLNITLHWANDLFTLIALGPLKWVCCQYLLICARQGTIPPELVWGSFWTLTALFVFCQSHLLVLLIPYILSCFNNTADTNETSQYVSRLAMKQHETHNIWTDVFIDSIQTMVLTPTQSVKALRLQYVLLDFVLLLTLLLLLRSLKRCIYLSFLCVCACVLTSNMSIMQILPNASSKCPSVGLLSILCLSPNMVTHNKWVFEEIWVSFFDQSLLAGGWLSSHPASGSENVTADLQTA